MRKAKLQLFEQTDVAALYTVCFEGDELSEFEKFICKFRENAAVQKDYFIILKALQIMLKKNGFLERYFRPEGNFNDDVCALPVDSGRLRLYCIRISDKILIAGNGGVKDVRTYQESEELNGYVMNLQVFDRLFKTALDSGDIEIEETGINILNDKLSFDV